jgi:hypothetical protein
MQGMRVDVMAVLRGVAPFEELWVRRTTMELEGGLSIEVLALPDLVQAKKTHLDKDWPMIRRLVEGHYARHRASPTPEQVDFWLKEARNPSDLAEVVLKYPNRATALASRRPALVVAAAGVPEEIALALEVEEKQERAADRTYWAPLRLELQELRRKKRQE